MTPEFSRPVRGDEIGGQPRSQRIEADAAERAALAERFALLALDRLEATLTLHREAGGVVVAGAISASGAQACVTSGEAAPFALEAPVALRFAETGTIAGDIELAAEDLDVEPWDGGAIDIGEVAAETLALALDPYPRAPGVHVPGVVSEDEARAEASPFRVLRGGSGGSA